MSKKVYVNIDMNGNSVLNAALNPLASAPANANPYYLYTSTANSDKGTMYVNVGTYASPVWKAVGSVQSVNDQTGDVHTYKGAWAASTTYYVGDMVVNGDNLYICKTQHTSSSSFSATNWVGIPPIDHSSTATTYGVGNDSKYGHLKLSDATDGTSDITGGTAATPKAVKSAYDLANAALPKTGGTMSGDIAMGGNKITGLADGTNDGDAVTKKQLDAAKLGALKPSGSIAFASLPALSASVLNNIYNITDAFTTTADFVEGSGISYPAGTNVAVINTGTDANPVYKYDTYTGVIDLSPYLKKDGTVAMTGNLAMGSHKITGLSNGTAATDAAAFGQIPVAATATPLMDGTAAVGSSAKWAKEDHVHPTDTSRAPLQSPALTGTPTAPTAASGTSTTQIATTEFVDAAVKGAIAVTTGTIDTSSTTVTVNYTGTFINAYAHQSGAQVITDVTVNSNNVVFTVAAAPSAAITCVVVAAKAAS